MQLQYKVSFNPSSFKINHHQNTMMVGSCFTENIGSKLSNNKFNTLLNPQGITFNPVSIANNLEAVLTLKEYSSEEVFENKGICLSWAHHSKIWDTTADAFLKKINDINTEANVYLKSADVLIITLGTSYAYKLKTTGEIVNNCHKQPAALFEKVILETDDMTERFKGLFNNLFKFNPSLKVILTISPVRHLKDGAFENNLSKGRLFSLVNELINMFPQVSYFPVYEIVIDELRDYRFFEKDWVHPNELAIDIVWDYFSKSYFSDETQKINLALKSLQTAMQHRFIHPEKSRINDFKESHLKMIKELEKQYPFLNFDVENNYFCTLEEKYF